MSAIIQTQTANEALPLAVSILQEQGYFEKSRNGGAFVFPGTFVTDYTAPQFRVLFSPARDANPFFHLFEAMWMLAGRNDLEFVKAFAKNMENFSADGETLHAAYGHRWRKHFQIREEGGGVMADQLHLAIMKLVESPGSRQVVIGIWDPQEDLADTKRNAKDRACNLSVVFTPRPQRIDDQLHGYVLDMTVYNRSNDIVWGAYGANYVHFGFLHEFVCAATCMRQGVYTQVGANTHMYTEDLYGEKLYSSLTAREFTNLAVHESAFNVHHGGNHLKVSADNLYLSSSPAKAMSHWGWNLNSYVRASDFTLWGTNNEDGQSLRRNVALETISSISNLSLLLDNFLSIRADFDFGRKSQHQDRLQHLFSDSAAHDSLPVFVSKVVIPMFVAHELNRSGDYHAAISTLWRADQSLTRYAESVQAPLVSLTDLMGKFRGVKTNDTGLSLDWFVAGRQWLDRRNAGKTVDTSARASGTASANEWNAEPGPNDWYR